ncbi:Remorin family protein [Euphorbia peplus]|nr:Remorin family protein [Euphorbia peplus]
MKKNLNSSLSLGTFPSPGEYQEKGWSSERVPHPSSGNSRRHISALTPFYSGRTMPSKWDDAERWISSPVLGYGVTKYTQFQQQSAQRRPKSKSGPIPPPGVAYYSNSSPSVQGFDSVCVRNFVGNSPFSTGVLMPKGIGTHFNGGLIGGQQGLVGRSFGGPGWSALASECSSPSSQDEKLDTINGDGNAISRAISRRDMATQMSPDDSACSSPQRSSSPPSIPLADHPAKLEIREVQVDKRATLISKMRQHDSFRAKKRLTDIQDNFNHNATASGISSWDVSEASSEFSKLQREEAKITAWENLQKAKAEAAIRKLEMKLEKKRASSIDKILSKLRVAQIKAQEMRKSFASTPQEQPQIPKISRKVSLFHRHKRFSPWNTCFTCHAL